MRLLYQTVFFLGLFSAITACHPGLDDDPLVVVTVEPEFRVDAFEQRDSSTGAATLGLWVESKQVYDCAGYRIKSAVHITGQLIEIDLLDVQRPNNCQGAPATATAFVAIGQLLAGSYPFRLTLGTTIVNEGMVNVENDRFSITFSKLQGLEIQNYTAMHLPDALLWGYAAVPDTAAGLAAQNFIADIKSISTESGLAPGFYSYFTVSGTGETYFHSSIAPALPVVMFVRKLTASPTELKNLLQTYRAGVNQQPLALRCFSTFGEF